MKIALDILLSIIKDFLKKQGLTKVVKKLEEEIEIDEAKLTDVLGKVSLNAIFKEYFTNNPKIKKALEKKTEELNEEDEDSESEESSVKPPPKKKETKKETEKLINNKKQRKQEEDDDDSESEEEVKPTKAVKLTKKPAKEESEDEDESEEEVKPAKQVKQNGTDIYATNGANGEKKSFKRIDDSLIQTIKHDDLKDNSYHSYMKKSGNDYGKVADEKLKVTKGRDFRKEKTKFKNKTTFGGATIDTAVRSIKLEDASDSD